MSQASDAKKCFVENVNLFGNATSHPENYNLYNGLALLAAAVEDLQREVNAIKIALTRR